jgi:hypothetical protein
MYSWLYSGKGFQFFRYCAWIVVAIGIFMAFMVATHWLWQVDATPRSYIPLRIIGGALGIMGAPAVVILVIGMACHCACDRDLSVGNKIWWFIIFFATGPFGSAVYFFNVYRPQVLRTGFASSV